MRTVLGVAALAIAAALAPAALAASAIEVEALRAGLAPARAEWDYVLDVHVRVHGAAAVEGHVRVAPGRVVAAEVAPLGGDLHRLRFPAAGLEPGDHVARVTASDGSAIDVPFTVATARSDTTAFRAAADALPLERRVASAALVHVLAARAPHGAPAEGLVAFERHGAPLARAPVNVTVIDAAGAGATRAGLTDPGGRVAWRADARADAGLPLVVAYLTGENRTIGVAAVALPVADRAAVVANVVPAPDGGVRVILEGAPGAGRVFLVKGDRALADAPLRAGEALLRPPAAPAPLASYALVALASDEAGGLESFGLATRGVDVDAAATTVAPRAQSAIEVLVRSFNDNLNGRADATMQATVRLVATGLPGGGSHSTEVTLAEGGEARVLVPLPAAKPEGEHTVRLRAEMGEVAAEERALVRVVEPPGAIERALHAMPAPSALVTGLTVALALALARRRPP